MPCSQTNACLLGMMLGKHKPATSASCLVFPQQDGGARGEGSGAETMKRRAFASEGRSACTIMERTPWWCTRATEVTRCVWVCVRLSPWVHGDDLVRPNISLRVYACVRVRVCVRAFASEGSGACTITERIPWWCTRAIEVTRCVWVCVRLSPLGPWG